MDWIIFIWLMVLSLLAYKNAKKPQEKLEFVIKDDLAGVEGIKLKTHDHPVGTSLRWKRRKKR